MIDAVTDAAPAPSGPARRRAFPRPATLLRPVAMTATLSAGCLIGMATVPVAFGWNSAVVMSGSMRPAFNPGDVVLSSPVSIGQLHPGEIVVVADPLRPGKMLMHRYVRPGSGDTIITRGDANASEDSTPVPYANVRGLPRMRVPFVGLPVLWLRTHALVPLAALLVLATAAVWGSFDPGRSRVDGRRAKSRGRRRRTVAVS
ncbi:MAG: signal peptidase [Frankiaceae bacterium]|nr:signal peptidase [Frankiaceae bacterium]